MKSAENERSRTKIVLASLLVLPFLLIAVYVLWSIEPSEREYIALRAALVLAVIGVLAWVFARAAARTARLIRDAAEGRTQFVDGARIAVIGTIEPEGVTVLSPIRNVPCVAYGYTIFHISTTRRSHRRVTDFHGTGMVPSYIASGVRKFRLLEMPVTEGVESEEVRDSTAIERARARVADVPFRLIPPLVSPGRQELASGNVYSADARTSGGVFDPNTMSVTEAVIEKGQRVAAIGVYSAAGSGLHRGVQLIHRGSGDTVAATATTARRWHVAMVTMFSIAAVLIVYRLWP